MRDESGPFRRRLLVEVQKNTNIRCCTRERTMRSLYLDLPRHHQTVASGQLAAFQMASLGDLGLGPSNVTRSAHVPQVQETRTLIRIGRMENPIAKHISKRKESDASSISCLYIDRDCLVSLIFLRRIESSDLLALPECRQFIARYEVACHPLFRDRCHANSPSGRTVPGHRKC